MKKRLNRRLVSSWAGLRYATLAGAALASVGCAESVGDLNRVQPDLISKDHFEGQWFIRETVVDVPGTLPGAFEGRESRMEAIVWDIQEDWLVGYRSYELVPGLDGSAESDLTNPNVQPTSPGRGDGRNPDLYKGNPIVAFRIATHADVQRGYNSRTGEQNNIISENTSDRPWYERDYMRVDWQSSGVDNIMMLQPLFGAFSTMSNFVPANEGGPDAFRVEVDEEGRANYIDFTVRRTMIPSVMGCLSAYWNNTIGDCTGEEVKIRTSMLKIDPEREQDYVPMVYNDQRMGEFGMFRVERPTYDRKLGNTFEGLIQLAYRHDMWQGSRQSDGEPLDFEARALSPITYTLSENYPEEMLPVTREIATEYDGVFKQIASAARGQSIAELEADLEADTGGSCLFCLNENVDDSARMGDVRYNFIYWVDDVQASSPLGYGPSSANPETGRIVSANAYVYGHGVDRSAETAKQMIDLMNGQIEEDDIRDATYVRNALRADRKPIDPRATAARLDGLVGEARHRALLGDAAFERFEALEPLGIDALAPATPALDQARIDALVDTRIEDAMIPEEWKLLDEANAPQAIFMRRLYEKRRQDALDAGEEVGPEPRLGYMSVKNWMGDNFASELEERQRIASENNLWLQEFSDPVLVGLAREMRDSQLTGDELYQELRERIFRGVMLHELGHTLGLRHNFSGSADALNFHDEYWEQRVKSIEPVEQYINGGQPVVDAFLRSNCSLPEPLVTVNGDVLEETGTEAACQEQRENQMVEYQYSTIMDYGGRFNSDNHGLGYYDRAALASSYGDLVEVFDEETMQGIAQASGELGVNIRRAALRANEVRTPVRYQGMDVAMMYEGQNGAMHSHYTNFPKLFGGYENLSKRHLIPRSEYVQSLRAGGDQSLVPVKVPYLACYDEFVDTVENCHRWDLGADPYEIVQDKLNSYEDYYVFNYFQRDRIGFTPWDVGRRTLFRYFAPVNNMFQHWYWGAAVTRLAPLETPRGELGLTAAVQGFQKLLNVMTTPDYGAHFYDPNSGVYEPVGADGCPEGMGDVTIPMDGSPGNFVQMPGCVNIPRGLGRSYFSRYDGSGYFIYRRVMEAGHFYDQLAALSALDRSNATVVGIGTDIAATDQRTFRLPYNLLFEDDLSGLYTSIYDETDISYGRHVFRASERGEGVVLGRDVFGPVSDEEMAELPAVRATRTYQTRVFSLVNGMRMLDGSLNPNYAMKGQISLAGSGEERTAPPGFVTVELTNPITGRSYIAYRAEDGADGPWYAADLLDEARRVVEDPAASEGAIGNVFGDIELVRLASSVLGN